MSGVKKTTPSEAKELAVKALAQRVSARGEDLATFLRHAAASGSSNKQTLNDMGIAIVRALHRGTGAPIDSILEVFKVGVISLGLLEENESTEPESPREGGAPRVKE